MTNSALNFLEVIVIKFKRFIAVFLMAVFCFQTVAFADSGGDPNIDNGGGNLLNGSSSNFWIPGNDGVRVTVVDAESGEVKSASIDYSNVDTSDIRFHFGRKCKAEYVGGASLEINTGEYLSKAAAQPLPTIISDGSGANIEAIRSYFTDEQVVRRIAIHTGIEFDKLTNGDYKLMLEPIMYITYNNVRTAMTATEAALYNQKTGGDLINKMGPLSHKNLPLAMFLEKDDLGYTAWKGSKNSYAADSDIIRYLGVGIVSFKEPEPEPEIPPADHEYRVDTDVYTSVTVSGGKHTESQT